METCRCGAERADAAIAEETPDAAPAPPPALQHWREAPLEALVNGFAAEALLPAGARLAWRSAGIAATLAVLVLTGRVSFGDPAPTRENIRVLARLDEHTRQATSRGNTVPSFLTLPGILAILPPSAPESQLARPIPDAALQRAFCSPSVATLVRFEYPTHYGGWSDARLERAVLEKHPEYRDRLCALPYEIDADPADVIRYELQPHSWLAWIGLAILTLTVATVFGGALVMLYVGVIVPAMPAAPQREAGGA